MKKIKKNKILKNTFSLCVPITPHTPSEAMEQLKKIQSLHPDFIEWRRDYMGEISLKEEKKLLSIMGKYNIPMIYTYRSECDGGLESVSDEDRLERVLTAMEFDGVAYIDVELNNPPYYIESVFSQKDNNPCGIILSVHYFDRCLINREFERIIPSIMTYEPDVIKIAHTPSSMTEAEAAVKVIKQFDGQIDVPIIHVLMGKYGQAARVFPEKWGGSLTYAVGEQITAPGQLSVEQIRLSRTNTVSHV